ncbi:MAG: MFS transporter, partial [Aeromonadales bacterium]|nr:MFS transporter [Aeromonadales bacterium]
EDIFKRPLMSGFHGGYSVGTIVGALLMSMLLTLGLGINISSLAIFIIMSAMILVGCRALVKDVKEFNAKEIKDADNTEKKSKINLPPVIIVLGFLCFIMYGSEGALLSWGTVFATQNRGIDPQIAGYFYIFFAVTMSFTRLVGNKLVSRLGRRRTVVIGALLVALGFFITAMTPHYIGMMIGFAIIGLGAGNIVPQLVSFAGTVKGIQVQSAISLINAIGFSGILLSPVIIGRISNMTSLERSFEILGVATFIVAVVSLKLLKKQKSN